MIYIGYIERQDNVVEISNISTIPSDSFIPLVDLVMHGNIKRLDFPLTILNNPRNPIITDSNELTILGSEMFNVLWEHSAIPFPKGYNNIKRKRAPRVSFHFQKSKLDIKDFRDRLIDSLTIVSDYNPSKILYRLISSIDLSLVEFISILVNDKYWTNTVDFIGISEDSVTIGAENKRTGFIDKINILPIFFKSMLETITENQYQIGLLDNVEYNHVMQLTRQIFNNCNDRK